jgi:hypothetical protein
MRLFPALTAISLFCLTATGVQAANLLTNGSFETGDLTGWTETGNLGPQSVTTGGYGAQDGSYGFYFGQVGSDGILSQTFSDTAGDTLQVTGWLAGNGSGYSIFNAGIDGTTGFSVSPVPNQNYTEFSFTVTATGSDTFSISFRNDPSYDEVDNLSVTDIGIGTPGGGAPVPEPGILALLGMGLAGLGITRRRKTAHTA